MAIFTEKGHGAPESEAGLSIIGAGMRVEGDIVAEGVVKIEGTAVGTVRAGRQVLVAKGGEVEGDVITKEAIIGGAVRGRGRAEGRIEVQEAGGGHGGVASPPPDGQGGGGSQGEVADGSGPVEKGA